MSTTRNRLVDAMKRLLWQRGYDATSPNQVLEASGAGKGSLYHHFDGKRELAIVAMESRADEILGEAKHIFDGPGTYLEKFEKYLLIPRNGLEGCRLGRIVQDPSVVEDNQLQRPLKRYFERLHGIMEEEFELARQNGDLVSSISSSQLAIMVISSVQGGFVISRANNDGDLIRVATRGIYSFLVSLSTS